MDCNGSVHNLFQVCSLHICNGNLEQLTVTATPNLNGCVVHRHSDILFDQLVLN